MLDDSCDLGDSMLRIGSSGTYSSIFDNISVFSLILLVTVLFMIIVSSLIDFYIIELSRILLFVMSRTLLLFLSTDFLDLFLYLSLRRVLFDIMDWSCDNTLDCNFGFNISCVPTYTCDVCLSAILNF